MRFLLTVIFTMIYELLYYVLLKILIQNEGSFISPDFPKKAAIPRQLLSESVYRVKF